MTGPATKYGFGYGASRSVPAARCRQWNVYAAVSRGRIVRRFVTWTDAMNYAGTHGGEIVEVPAQ